MRPDLLKGKKPCIPKHIEKALKSRKVKKIIQSSQFDIPFFRMKTGIHIRNVWDTQVMEQVILGGRGNPWHDSDLDIMLNRRFKINLDKSTRQSFIGYWGLITKKQEKYGIADIAYLYRLAKAQIKDLYRDKLEAVAVLENRTCEVTAELRYNGIAFDEQFWIDLAEENMREYQRRLKKLKHSGVDNWNSEKQIKKFFWEEHEIEIESLSKLPDVKNKDLDAFKFAREMFSSTTTYGLGFLTRKGKKKSDRTYPLVDPDGRIRPSYNQIVDTGRYSCSKPNLQNQPAFGLHRFAYIAMKGCDLVGGDFTGQELGAIAAGSQDPVWLTALRNGHDLHSVMADKMYPDWQKVKAKGCKFPYKCDCPEHLKRRRPAKDLNFGISYGKSTAAYARDRKIPLAQAKKEVRAWRKPIPYVNRWLNKNGDFAVKHKWIRTLPPFNRIRYLFEEEWRRRNQGKNTPIQGSGADMMKLAMCLIYEYIYDNDITHLTKMVLTVHDELLTECKKSFSKQWAKIVKFFMEEAAMVVTKEKLIPTEPEIFERWKPKDVSEEQIKQAERLLGIKIK